LILQDQLTPDTDPTFDTMPKKDEPQYTHMKAIKIALAKRWRTEGKTLGEIALLLKRDVKAIRKQTDKKKPRAKVMKVGRPPMPEAVYTKCDTALVTLQKRAGGQKEVTAAMVIKKARVDYCEKVVRKAFADHGKPFRKLREKPLLKTEDFAKRLSFCNANKGRRANTWVKKPHAIIDNKKFPMYLQLKDRQYAARRAVRGAYRTGGQAVEGHLVKPKATLKYPVTGVMISAGIINGRVRFWHVTEGRWNAKKAVEMYVALAKVLKKVYPSLKKWEVLEDNDPAGYKATAAVNKKAELALDVMELPPRSPDLNALDYSVWSQISKCMRQQEANFPKSKRESKAAFIKRLRATALGLPSSFVTAAVKSMRRRCQQIAGAKGALIEE
jgi:hypothetical protein